MSITILIIESRGAIAEKLSKEAERRGFLVHIAHCGNSGTQCFLKRRILQEEFDVISVSSPLATHPFEVLNDQASSIVIDYLATKKYKGTVIHCIDKHTYTGRHVDFPFFLNETIVQSHGLFNPTLIEQWGSVCEESVKEKVSTPAILE